MRNIGVFPDCFTFPPVVRSCGVISDLFAGKQAHCDTLKHGLYSRVHLQSALVAMYAQNWAIPEAELVFEETEVKNLVSWTAIVAGYAQNGVKDKAAETLIEMIAAGVRPNEITLASVLPTVNSAAEVHGYTVRSGLNSFVIVENALVAAYGRCGQVNAAQFLFDGMVQRTIVTWNTIIGVYEGNGKERMAIELFRRMTAENVDFDYITLVSVISACASLADLEMGRVLHRIAEKKRLLLNPSVGNALLNMYAKCGSLEAARELFHEMPARSVVSWTAIISAYAAQGRGQEALELFSRMKSMGPPPNASTFLSILTACSHSILVSEGKEIFTSMERDFSLRPSDEHFACMVDLLSRAGQLREALEFIEETPARRDGDAWAALLGGCRVHGDVTIAEMAAERIIWQDRGCAAGYILMANIYAEAGRWEDADRLRKRMKVMELQKKPAFSMVKTKA